MFIATESRSLQELLGPDISIHLNTDISAWNAVQDGPVMGQASQFWQPSFLLMGSRGWYGETSYKGRPRDTVSDSPTHLVSLPTTVRLPRFFLYKQDPLTGFQPT